MTNALEGKSAVITGAGSGIGAAIAEAFAGAGASLCLVDKSPQGLAEVAKRCSVHSKDVVAITADVSDEAAVERLFISAVRSLGKIDILVNNAGILTECLVEDMSTEMFDEIMAVDLRSVFLCCRSAIPDMKSRGFGRIINISSQLGQKGGVGLAHYSAAKAGVIGFTRALARELGPHGITANCIAPGPIHTPLAADLSDEWVDSLTKTLPLGRFGEPAEVAPTAVLLATEPGGNLYTGQTLGPNSGDVMI